jgi:hypothetical protein
LPSPNELTGKAPQNADSTSRIDSDAVER